MKRQRVSWSVAFVTICGSLVGAQAVVSLDEFDRAMKTIDKALMSVRQAADARSYLEAKVPLALSRQTLASTRPWWATQQDADGVRMTRTAVAALDALDKVLSTPQVDATTVTTAVRDVTHACESCHAVFREGDAQTGYRVKARSAGQARQ